MVNIQHFVRMLALAIPLALAAPALAQQAETPDDDRDHNVADGSPVPIPFDDDNEDEYERAKLLLSGFHGLPAKEVFEQKLDDPRGMMLSLAMHEQTAPMYRKQALAALGYWSDKTVRDLYVRLLEEDTTAENIRHRLMLLIADHFPHTALAKLTPYLADDDLQRRLTAIEAIRKIPSTEAVNTLKEAAKSETHPIAKKRLEQYTQTLR